MHFQAGYAQIIHRGGCEVQYLLISAFRQEKFYCHFAMERQLIENRVTECLFI